MVSVDARYNGLAVSNVFLRNIDNVTAGFSIDPVTSNNVRINTSEGAATATFTIVLIKEPTANASITFNSDDLTEG
ncbi:MAG: hypothetical protein HQK53_14825 [Oligoflexia bacterium]|nr:hypothetical protein [Oligoflexia bacterium]